MHFVERALSAALGPRLAATLNRRMILPARERRLRSIIGQPPTRGKTLPAIDLKGDFERTDITKALRHAYEQAMRGAVALPAFVRDVPGMSGGKYRELINELIRRLPNPRYLEIGSWAGSTAIAALAGNSLTAVCIDDWSQFGGPREAFIANTSRVLTDAHRFRLIESDFRKVDYARLGKFKVFLFDGPHKEQDQFDGLVLPSSALDDEFVLIVDDWNRHHIRVGTLRGIAHCRWSIVASIEIRSSLDGSHPSLSGAASDWHNGYFIAVIDKR